MAPGESRDKKKGPMAPGESRDKLPAVATPLPIDGMGDLGVNNASIFELHHDPTNGAITPVRLNDTAHLPEVT